MTCIVAFTDGKTVTMGGDSAGVSNWHLSVRKDPKVLRKGEFLFGFTDSFRMGQLLRFSLRLPDHPEGMDAYEYVTVPLVNAVRECLKAGGYARKEADAEAAGTFIVGYQGRLFTVHGDYGVSENSAPYEACGCGYDVALGAMDATDGLGLGAQERIARALAAAERWSAGVRGPFVIEVL